MRDKQLCVVAYLLELGCDWMMSPTFNLSRMPGFEAAGLTPFEKDNQSTLNVIASAAANMIASAPPPLLRMAVF
jgi:hypothetical protein